MSADRLAEIKARADAATPGPWSAKGGFTSDPMIEVYGQTVFINPDLDGDPIQPGVWADVEFIAAAREDVPWLVSEVARLTAERDALAAGRCMADTTLREEEHRLVLCVLPEGHRTAHDDLLGTSWTDGTHYDPSEVERDALAAQVARVEALADHWAKRAASDYEAGGTLTWGAADVHFSAVLREALVEPTGQEVDLPLHRTEAGSALDTMGADQ